MALRYATLIVILMLASMSPVRAATTVFAGSVLSTTGPVTNPTAALGAADGVSASISRPGVLVLATTLPATGAGLVINGAKTGSSTQVRIAVGAIVNGIATFTATQNFPNAAGPATFDFSADCAAISAAGCNLISFSVVGSPVGSFTLDGLSAISNAPEPQIWALMILGFIFTAGRLKRIRAGRLVPARA